MKKIITTIVLCLALLSVNAQIQQLAGPRVGMTMISAGSLASILRKDVPLFSDDIREEWTGSTGKYGAVTSQYGWQWESRFADGYDVTGLVEWVVLVGGMEKGLFLPSVSSLVGARTSSGFEFAVGPNLSLSGIGMVFGAGFNFKAGDLNLPVNIAFTPSVKKTQDRHSETYDPITDEWEYTEWEEGTGFITRRRGTPEITI